MPAALNFTMKTVDGNAVDLSKYQGREIRNVEPVVVALEPGRLAIRSLYLREPSHDTEIFVDGTAFVVSVRNNTVITAVGSEHMREHVFTNIDSAVIA